MTHTKRTTIRTTNMTNKYQLWDLIETSSFPEDIKDIKDNDDDENNILVPLGLHIFILIFVIIIIQFGFSL